MPEPHEFLSARQHDGSTLEAADIYRETWEWLDKLGVAKAVSPQLLERYAMCSARWIQCEEMTTKLGYLSKPPTTGKPIPSPFINIGINYMKSGEPPVGRDLPDREGELLGRVRWRKSTGRRDGAPAPRPERNVNEHTKT